MEMGKRKTLICPVCNHDVTTNAPDQLLTTINSALATIRQEERRAVWSNVFNVVSAEGSFGARQLIKSLEGAREQDGCGPTKAAANENKGSNHD